MAKVWRFEVHSFSSISGQDMVSSLHYQTDVPVGEGEPSGETVLNEVLEHFSSSSHNLSVWRACAYGSTTFTRCRMREEVEWWDGEIGDVFEETIGLTGSLGSVGSTVTPPALAPWIGLRGAEALRSARGGVHLPGPFSALALGSDGTWSTGGTLFTNITALGVKIVDHLENVFGVGSTGDINPVIYSPTRRRRGQNPWTFDMNDARPSAQPRWLRSRMTEL